MKIKSIKTNHSYEEYDINGNNIINNQYPGNNIKSFYDKDNRLIKKIVVEDEGVFEFVYEHKYEYNNFGYRISVFKIKKTYPITTLKTKTDEIYEPISITDVKTENGKIISETITDFSSKKIEKKIHKPKEEEVSLTENCTGKYDATKYDENNRIIESICEGGFDEIYITEYQYSLINLKDSFGGDTYKKTLRLLFEGRIGEEGLSGEDELILESISIEIFDDDGKIINRVFQHTSMDERDKLIKRKINSNKKYYSEGEDIFIDKTFDKFEKEVELYEYKWLTKENKMLVSITTLSIINDNISVVDKIEYRYFDE